MNLSQAEEKLVKEMQADLAKAKKALRDVRKNAREMMAIQLEAGRAKEGNAVLRLIGEVKEVAGKLDVAHANASDALCDCFDEGPGIVAFGGGGR